MPYRSLSIAVSILFGALCITLIVLPELIYWMFQLQGNSLGDFLAKRAGVLFLGLSVLCYHSRNTRSAEIQRLVSLTIALTMAAMAFMGALEFFKGVVGAGIFVAIIVELGIALMFCAYLVRR